MTGRLRAYVPLGVIIALAVAGCSGTSNEASPTLTPVTSTTSVAAPPTSTTSPPQAVVRAGPPPKTPFTKAGAELFVRDYYATINAALHRGSGGDLVQRYLMRGCDCDNLVAILGHAHDRRQHFVGRGFTLRRVLVTNLVGAAAVVRVTFGLDQMRVKDADGRTVDHTNEVNRQTNSLILLHEHGGWVVEKVLLGRPA